MKATDDELLVGRLKDDEPCARCGRWIKAGTLVYALTWFNPCVWCRRCRQYAS